MQEYLVSEEQINSLEELFEKAQKKLNEIKERKIDIITPKPNSKYIFFSDAGHGAINPNTGLYATNGKFWKFEGYDLHLGNLFLEGVSNRIIEEKVISLCEADGIEYIRLHHDYLDTSLAARVEKANNYHKRVKKGFGISIHSNAANTKARGWSVWTSPGQTQSDKLADVSWYKHKSLLEKPFDVRMMSQTWTDTDYDYEAGFYMLTRTSMPFILTENLFFDNIEDMKLLMREDVQDAIAKAHYQTIIWGMDNLVL